jgi:hypothetical protein
MRRISVSLVTLGFILTVFGSSLFKGNAKTEATVLPQSRCTRLTYPPKKKSKQADATTFGSRCTRLTAGGKPGSVMPNTAPKVGLAASTAYIAANADSQVKLKTIACDAENDTLLYTYSSTGGRITGDGAEAVLNLSGVARPGTYTVSVEVDDGCGCISFESASVTLE